MVNGDIMVSTEEAVVIFGLAIGAGGALSQLIASQRLETITNQQLTLQEVAIPSLLATGAIMASSTLLPSATENVI